MKSFPLLLILPFLFSFPEYHGKVVAIADGDTFTLLVDKTQIKIRLHGIDCPEKAQDYGNVAKQFLSDKIFGKFVTVQNRGKDRNGRIIGMVLINGHNVNEALIQAGLAWHYKTYDKNPIWDQMEDQAKKEKKGLWSGENPIPPWTWRQIKRNKK